MLELPLTLAGTLSAVSIQLLNQYLSLYANQDLLPKFMQIMQAIHQPTDAIFKYMGEMHTFLHNTEIT